MFAGGNIRRLTVFALGIMPYITASIILQLLTVVVPTLEKLSKEGELGRRKITQWTRYLTIILSFLQSLGIARGLMSMQQGIVINPGIGFTLLTVISLTTGTAFIMWLGEQISERGIGNGMSLIIFTGIVVGLPRAIGSIYQNVFVTKEWNAITLLVLHGGDDRGGGLHRPGGARRAAHPGAIRQARGGAEGDGRAVHPHAAEGQRRRRDPGDLRLFDPGVSQSPCCRCHGSRT